jgi:hypothetical protein
VEERGKELDFSLEWARRRLETKAGLTSIHQASTLFPLLQLSDREGSHPI